MSTYDENTLSKVYEGLGAAGIYGQVAVDAVGQMQNRGILFREREAEREATPPSGGVGPEVRYDSDGLPWRRSPSGWAFIEDGGKTTRDVAWGNAHLTRFPPSTPVQDEAAVEALAGERVREAEERGRLAGLREAKRSTFCGCAWCCATTDPDKRGSAHSICRAAS